MSVLLLLKSDRLGTGDDELGKTLMKKFLDTVLASERRVDRIVCMNSAVFLTTEGTPVLGELQDFERQGVTILSCLTCLKYYGLEKKVVVGGEGDMVGTVAAIFDSDKVISP